MAAEWVGYRVRLRLGSPIHIGARIVGNLQMTRRYVPGTAIWGALTSRLARDRYDQRYPETGALVDDSTRFSYLYFSDRRDRVSIWPWGAGPAGSATEEDSLSKKAKAMHRSERPDQGRGRADTVGNPTDEFNWRFVRSHAGTAVGDCQTAEAGSLHETEYIAPIAEAGVCAVWLHGYFWIRDAAISLADAKHAWLRVQLGGERAYGWGRIAEACIDPLQQEDRLFGCLGWGSTHQDVYVDLPREGDAPIMSQPILAHVVASEELQDAADGFLEPMVCRQTQASAKLAVGRFGQWVSDAVLAWVPGTRWSGRYCFRIRPRGYWEYCDVFPES